MTPELQSCIFEVHPEVSFWALNGERTLDHWKRTPGGATERIEILRSAYEDDVSAIANPSGAARDDLYDAMAVVWTAGRIAHGQAQTLPDEPEVDAHGLRMEIVY